MSRTGERWPVLPVQPNANLWTWPRHLGLNDRVGVHDPDARDDYRKTNFSHELFGLVQSNHAGTLIVIGVIALACLIFARRRAKGGMRL